MGYFLLVLGLWPQVILSKRPNRWLGLIIPALLLLGTIAVVLYMLDYPIFGAKSLVISFLYMNIPTSVYLLVYGFVRQGEKRKRELARMSAEDLG